MALRSIWAMVGAFFVFLFAVEKKSKSSRAHNTRKHTQYKKSTQHKKKHTAIWQHYNTKKCQLKIPTTLWKLAFDFWNLESHHIPNSVYHKNPIWRASFYKRSLHPNPPYHDRR
jgi:hypothetical protein